MKQIIIIAIVVVLGGVYAWLSFSTPEKLATPVKQSEAANAMKIDNQSSTIDANQNVDFSVKPPEFQEESTGNDKIDKDLARSAAEKGQEIEDLIQKYQNNLNNPEVRAKLEAEIQSKMEAYETAVLPLAIDKMKEGQ